MTHSYVHHELFIGATHLYRVAKTRRMLRLQVIFRKRASNYRALLRKMTCKDKASYGSSPPCECITYVRRVHMCDAFMGASRLIHICDKFIRALPVIHMCDMTHSHTRHDFLTCVTWRFCTCDTPYDHTRDIESRRLIGRLKLQVIFHLRATNYRALFFVCVTHPMPIRVILQGGEDS